MNEDTMWKTIDEWLEKNIAADEAVTSVHTNGALDVGIRYARIRKGKLIQREFDISKTTLQKLTAVTVEIIMADVMTSFRRVEE